MSKTVQILIAIVLVAVAIGVAVLLVRTAPKTKKAPAAAEITLVDVVAAEQVDAIVQVQGQGTVVAAHEVTIKAEVGGRVVWVSPNLVQGGRVKRNALLFKVDDRDYVLAVEQQEANVQRARFELAQEKGRARVAAKEWKLLGADAPSTPEGKALALREPQLKASKAALASAQSGLEIAKLNVQRTKYRAPFNAFVKMESVEVGQLVDRQTNLGSLVNTDEFWVQVSIPVSDLQWIVQADPSGNGGSTATLRQRLTAGKVIQRTGKVVHLAGDLDPRGRMARLVVSVEKPMDTQGDLPLLLGAYVDVTIAGKTLDDVIALPRRAVHANDEVWVMNDEARLEIRSVKVVHRSEDIVYATDGVAAGDRVVTSRIVAPIDNMPLRTPEPSEAEVRVKATAGPDRVIE